jgi:hypothetical protein
MNASLTVESFREREPDVGALVLGLVEVVAAAGVFDPIG